MATKVAKDEILKVKVLNKSYIKPKNALGRKRYFQLVTYDLPYLAFQYTQKLLIYKGGEDEFGKMVQKLENGLRVVLEDYYQLAGKLGKDDEGVFRIEYDESMSGVEVNIAKATDENIKVNDLIEEESSSKLKEFVPYHNAFNLEGLNRSLLAVQFTKVKDGVVLGCAFNHGIMDGASTWNFMNDWAQICSGTHTISIPPFLDRTKARNTRVKYNLSLSHLESSKSPPILREKLFRFSNSEIELIKSKVNAGPLELATSKPLSTFQCLSTHMWHAISRARQLKPDDHTVFTLFADCRNRVNPPMPKNYFGNLIRAVFTATSAGLLLAKPMKFGASLIQNSIDTQLNNDAINAKNDEWEREPKILSYKDAGVNSVVVGSSPRFRVFDVDFGWGRPESVRNGSNNKFDGMVYLHQGKDGGNSIDVDICLENSTMEKLENDTEFLLRKGSF